MAPDEGKPDNPTPAPETVTPPAEMPQADSGSIATGLAETDTSPTATADAIAKDEAALAAAKAKEAETPKPGETPKEGDPAKAGDADLPPGPGKDMYQQVKEMVGEKPGPIGMLFLCLARLMAKYGGAFSDYFEGFDSKLDKGDLSKEKLGTEDADKLKQKLAAEDLKAEIDPEKYKGLGEEESSTQYACELLGIPIVKSSEILAARLKHLDINTDKIAYGSVTFDNLQKTVKKGTILVFRTQLVGGQKVVAVANGNKDEFQYYNSKTGKVDIFHINPIGDEKAVITVSNFVSAYAPMMDENEVAAAQAAREKEEADKKARVEQLKANPESPYKTMKEFEKARKSIEFSEYIMKTFDEISKDSNAPRALYFLRNFFGQDGTTLVYASVKSTLTELLNAYAGPDKDKIVNGIDEFDAKMADVRQNALSKRIPLIDVKSETDRIKDVEFTDNDTSIIQKVLVQFESNFPEIFSESVDDIKRLLGLNSGSAEYRNMTPEFKALLEKYKLI